MIHALTLRAYKASDSAACLATWRAASEAGHPFLSAAELDDDEILVRDIYLPQANITLACNSVGPVGFVALIDRFIGGLFVNPCQHRCGIGRMLVERVAQTHGPLAVEVYQQNERALKFYEASDFIETARRMTDDRGRPYPLVRLQQSGAG